MIRKQDDLVGSMFHDIAHLIRLKIDVALKPHELTRLKWLAIGIIQDASGLSQTDLSRRLELKTAATGKLVDRLEARGLVERRPDPSDRRAYRLFGTKKADNLLSELMPAGSFIRDEVLIGLDAKEINDLENTLKKIKANLLGPTA